MPNTHYASITKPNPFRDSQGSRSAETVGTEHLTDLEILTTVLGPGRGPAASRAARRVLEGGGLGALGQDPSRAGFWSELHPAQADRLKASVELSRRLAPSRESVLRTPADVHAVTADLRYLAKEHFVGLYLNTRNRLLVRETISVGSLNVSVVHPREVFQPALRSSAASLIVVHNHPSGDTDPSDDDIALSRRLAEAGEILGIALLDHVIVGRQGYTSLKESQVL